MKLTEKLTWVSAQMARTDLQATTKVVLFALVERSDNDGVCYPSVRTLSVDAGVSRATAVRGLKTLVDLGVVRRSSRRDGGGGLTSSLYVVDFEAGCPQVTEDAEVVYFARATVSRRIKIGVTRDLANRVQAIESSSPEPIELIGHFDGGRVREAELHAQFSHARLHGEWFEPIAELEAFLLDTFGHVPPLGSQVNQGGRFTGEPTLVHVRPDPRFTGEPTLGSQVNQRTLPLNPPIELKKSGGGSPPTPVDTFVETYNRICSMLTPCKTLTKTRRNKIQTRLRERPLDAWETVFQRIAASEFLTGGGDRGWRADLDWIIANEGNAVKVLEGKYDHVQQPQQRSFRSSGKMSVTEATQIALDRYREEQRRKGDAHADGRGVENLRLVDASVSARGES